jgi:hypothetical protein
MASMTLPPNNPVTQIIYLTIPAEKNLKDGPTSKIWSKALTILESHPGFLRLYWGRSAEHPEKVQLHVGKFSSHSLPDLSAFRNRP